VAERIPRAVVLAAIAAVLLGSAPPVADPAGPGAVRVSTDAQFESAVAALSSSGGTIVLLPNHYRDLVVPPRGSRPLRIVGRPGARVEHLLLHRTRQVAIGPLTVSPVVRDAWIDVVGSDHVLLHNLLVTAYGTTRSAWLEFPHSEHVTVRHSTFTHCGDWSRAWSNCILPRGTSRHVTIVDNWFHDCYGCDFIHGRFRSDLKIIGNRLERALPCRINPVRCGHQDLVELFAGQKLRVEDNHFGVYAVGGGQVLLAGPVDHVRIINNVFVGADPRVPFYRSRVGVGLAGSKRVPHDVRIVNNTILTGATRIDGYDGSIILGWRYRELPKSARPLVANNVIGVMETPGPFCERVGRTVANVVIRGRDCSSSDHVGPASLDRRLRPTLRSRLLLDAASARYAPPVDIGGYARTPAWPPFGALSIPPVGPVAVRPPSPLPGTAPDVGAYEYLAAARLADASLPFGQEWMRQLGPQSAGVP
jgi:hypothetical protein